jgi:peptide/nickel transport system substrate-binding protein
MLKRFLSVLIVAAMVVVASSGMAAQKPIEYRWGSVMRVSSLDIRAQTSDTDYIVANNLYDTLIFPSAKEVYTPWIADSWEITPDGLQYTFRLKKGVLFHDMTEVTADDVAFSIDRLVNLGGSIANFFKACKPGSTKVLDKYTVQFNLAKRDPAFMVSLFLLKILNKDLVLAHKEPGEFGEMGDYGAKFLQTHEAGSGPYVLVDYKHGDRIKMRKFQKYSLSQWKENSIDTVTIYTIPEAVTLVTEFKAGNYDEVHWAIPVTTIRKLQKDDRFSVAVNYLPRPWIIILINK